LESAMTRMTWETRSGGSNCEEWSPVTELCALVLLKYSSNRLPNPARNQECSSEKLLPRDNARTASFWHKRLTQRSVARQLYGVGELLKPEER
jgi:hypothetical protein